MTPLAKGLTEKHSSIGIDALRGGAAFIVLLTHARASSFVGFGALPFESQGWIVRALFAVTRLGHEAVIVFFALSGFLVAGRAIEAAAEGHFSLSNYTIDRVTRILIPLAGACLFTAIVIQTTDQALPPLFRVFANAVGLNGIFADTLKYNSPLWSLTFEIWFYILLGGVLGIRAFPAAGACAAFVGIIVFAHLNAFYLLLWFIGALSYVYRGQLARPGFAIVGMVLLPLGIVMFQSKSDSQAIAKYVVPWTAAQAEAVICCGTTLLLPMLLLKTTNSKLQRFNTIAKLFSNFSYSLYLTHAPLLALLLFYFPTQQQIDIYSVSLFIGRIALCLAFAWIFNVIFERGSYLIRAQVKERRTKRTE